MHRFLLAALLALIAGPACADPFSVVSTLSFLASGIAGPGTFLTISGSTWFYVGVAAAARGADRAKALARRLGGAK